MSKGLQAVNEHVDVLTAEAVVGEAAVAKAREELEKVRERLMPIFEGEMPMPLADLQPVC